VRKVSTKPRINRLFVAWICSAAMAVAGPSRVDAAGSLDVGPEQSVAGISQGEWSIVWWQWAASFDYGHSPVVDTEGGLCGASQRADVWFLAGTYESTPIERECTVPRGAHLFFPLVNYFVSGRLCDQCTCEMAKSIVRQATGQPMALFAELDGRAIPDLQTRRVSSPRCFDLAGRQEHHSGQAVAPTASDGYWVMLKPLAPGHHLLRFGGTLPTVRQDVTYHIDVR
jgi:hypothetical protein